MTVRNKASLTLLFEQNDIPSGTDYADFIDSYVNAAETSAQTLLSPLTVNELITPRVSATNGNFTGSLGVASTISANAMGVAILQVATAISANNAHVHASALTVTSDVSADSIYASAVRSTSGFFGGVGVVSAAGTAQGTAALLSFAVNRGKGIVDGSTTGFAPPANRAGLVQYLFNEGASANLWPPTGGTINGLAANTPLALAASAMVTIVHLTASAYAVK